ncbi:conserved hypothetical protein [Rubrivivax sp. A210]|uniref:hypothetical protein n=1 Tax=Rubrivivax sp. A210 TaxID=2772301 RepID=UPI0019183D1B|nr:hypothetical protein [Rubrivivax sp. A210]CAD5366600.1 conserved hypothetical protein [Rubrivivax sp. A210]
MSTNVIPAAQVAEMEATGQSVAIGDKGETVEVWEYFAENIDDFATAKTIVDHFAENPKLLHSDELDLHGLFVRAKLTIKRQHIAYARAQAAIDQAREKSRGLRGVRKSFAAFVASVRSAVASNPTPVVLAVGLVASYWLR